MTYVDGFVLTVPKRKVPAYRRMARVAGKVWMQHGALQYVEAVGDDLKIKKVVSFAKITRLKRGETVVFSWISYKSRAHRDAVNARVMKDKRIVAMMNETPPFDLKRMVYGGFKSIVEL